jgi:hypothetical protein
LTAKYPWEEEPASRWTRDFSRSARDNRVPLPTTQLEQEGVGEKITVHDLFDRWVLNESVHLGRGTHFAEVTKDCKGKIELDFALTPAQSRQMDSNTTSDADASTGSRIRYLRHPALLLTRVADEE